MNLPSVHKIYDMTNLNKNRFILKAQPKYNHFSTPESANTMYQLHTFSLHAHYFTDMLL